MTPFTKRVYRVVSHIPIGEVRTYQWVAARAGNPGAARAVGRIMKLNPYPLLIPCHRVVASTGESGGYAYGGRRVKKILLGLEKAIRKEMEL